MVLALLIALALVVVCNVAWLLAWSRRRERSGPNRIQVAGDNSTQISGTNITINATHGSLAAHSIDGAVTIDHGKISVSQCKAGITRDGRVWAAPPDTPASSWHRRVPLESCLPAPNAVASDTIRPQTPWERQLATQQECDLSPGESHGLAAILAGLYRVQSIALTLKLGSAIRHVGELPTGLTMADKNTLFYDEKERCGYLWDGSRFLIKGVEDSPVQLVPPEFVLGYASPIPVRDFKATSSCPRCGWVDAHYLHTTDLPEGATIGRECTNCQKQWGEK